MPLCLRSGLFPDKKRIELEATLNNRKFMVRKAAVLGAGVMGAQIAAHLVNANVETLLFELPAEQGGPTQTSSRQ